MKPQKPFRMRFNFWLDMSKQDEFELADTIDILKEKRSFTAVVRDGIRLIVDLKRGKTDVLRELFPAIVAGMEGQRDSIAVAQFQAIIAQLQTTSSADQSRRVSTPNPAPIVTVSESDISDEEITHNMLSLFGALEV